MRQFRIRKEDFSFCYPIFQYSDIPGYSEEGECDENGSLSMFWTTDGNSPSGSESHLGIENVRPFALDLHSNLSSLSVLPDQRKF